MDLRFIADVRLRRACDLAGFTLSGTLRIGARWTPIFDRQTTISIGDIAVDPHNQDVVWVGTREANARNSVSFGDGVYKTLDGGRRRAIWACATRITFRASSSIP